MYIGRDGKSHKNIGYRNKYFPEYRAYLRALPILSLVDSQIRNSKPELNQFSF